MHTWLMAALVFLPIAASMAVFPVGRRSKDARDRMVLATACAELAGAAALLLVQGRVAVLPEVCGLGLSFVADGFRTVMVLVTALLWVLTTLPAKDYFARAESRNRYYLFNLITLGGMMGVFLSADLFTTFVFFEIMSFASYVWVVQNETDEARQAANLYLAVAVIGGLTLLMGLFLLQYLLGSLRIDALAELAAALPPEKRGMLYAAGGCCLFGFGAKAGMFPMHIWLPKAHPAAPAPASALLSGILTKGGIFGVLVISRTLFLQDMTWSNLILWLGAATMLGGAVLAVFSIDLKRTLACSSISQIGFILVGVGMQGLLGHENALAAWGTALHMVNHSLVKLVLFVAAGVVYLGCHALDLNEVRGFAGSDKPWLGAVFAVGALGIMGVPGFSGYISKTLLHESIVEYIHLLEAAGTSAVMYQFVEVLFLFTGGLTVAYMLKLFVALCIDPKMPGHHVPPDPYMDRRTTGALTVGALLLPLLGMTAAHTMQPIGEFAAPFTSGAVHAETIHYFAWVNLKGAFISLAIGFLIYFLVIRKFLLIRDRNGHPQYLDRWPKGLDLEERIYRPLLQTMAFWCAAAARFVATLGDSIIRVFRDLIYLRAPDVVKPKGDDEFGVYGNDPERDVVTETFAFDLLMAGVGIVCTLAYLLLR